MDKPTEDVYKNKPEVDRTPYHKMSDEQIKALPSHEALRVARSFDLSKKMSDDDLELARKIKVHHGGDPRSDGRDSGGEMFSSIIANIARRHARSDMNSEPKDEPIVLRKGRSASAHEKAVQDLMAAAAEGEATETPLADIVAKRNKNKVNEMVDATSSDNIDMQIAATYIQMVEQGLVEQVINEMENLLQESFNDEEYAMMYEYVNSVLKEGRTRRGSYSARIRRKRGNMAKDYKGRMPGKPNTNPLSREEIAQLGILTGPGAIHDTDDSRAFSRFFMKTQAEKARKEAEENKG